MKILNLQTNNNGLFSPSGYPNGGLEKVVYDFHKLMETEHKVLTPCSPNDICKNEEGFLPITPKTAEEWRKGWKDYKITVINLINKEKPDVIIVHGSGKMMNHLNKNGFGVFYVDHQPDSSVNKLYHEGFFTKDASLNRELGGVIFGVSAHSNDLKEQTILKQGISQNFKYDGWIKFQYITPELERFTVEENHNKKAITIGNSNSIKSPHKIEWLRKKKFVDDYNIITMHHTPMREKDTKYWEKHIESKPEIFSRTFVNLDREKTLTMLRESMIYVSTCPNESAGITAIEALSFGVPVLMFTPAKSLKHSSMMFAPDRDNFCWLSTQDDRLKEFVEKSRSINRNDIRDIAWSENNPMQVRSCTTKVFETYLNGMTINYDNESSLLDFI